MAAKRRLFEESSHKLVVLYFMNILLPKSTPPLHPKSSVSPIPATSRATTPGLVAVSHLASNWTVKSRVLLMLFQGRRL